MTTEELNTYKRIHWAHQRALWWLHPTENRLCVIDGITYENDLMYEGDYHDIERFKPILRALDDLTKAEKNTIYELEKSCKKIKKRGKYGAHAVFYPEYNDIVRLMAFNSITNYLLGLGIDVYGLIEKGEAISEVEAKEKGWLK